MKGEVIVERDGPVARIILSNPAARNALTYAMYDELARICHELAHDRGLRVIIFTGVGGAFAGGTDIRDLREIRNGTDGVEYERYIAHVQASVGALRVPLVAMVSGPAVGGGLVLAAQCDLVYCTPDARFGSPIARTLGNTLSPTSLARLYSCFGRRRTSEMLMTGRLVDAATAEAAGFVNAVVEPERLEEHVSSVVADILRCAPLSLWTFKELERRVDRYLEDVPTEDVYRTCYGSRDFATGVDSFLARQPPTFEGR